MKSLSSLIILILMLSCNNSPKTVSAELEMEPEYKNTIEIYRSELMNNRKSGYLQLVGLLKMDQKNMVFGKDPSNYLGLDHVGVPDYIGTFTKLDSLIVFNAHEGVAVSTQEDIAITGLELHLDEFGSSELLFHDNLKWQVITRNEQPYLRVWDSKNPGISQFRGFEFYPLNRDMIFDAEFKYYENSKSEKVDSQLGPKASTVFIGQVHFVLNGKSHALDVGNSGFTMVADRTTSTETYGGGRYMYLNLPEKDGRVKLDFNKLYNPPCSFNKFTTCLYPPQQNDLDFKIKAGEMMKLKSE